jgi:hypothetical protein
MELPDNKAIAEAIAEAKRLGETPAQMEERVEDLCRWSDADLAAVGVFPPPPPDASSAKSQAPAPDALDFEPAPRLRDRRGSWTADKQRAFIAALAETGCVSEACARVGITARSAYRLREHPAAAAFRGAWDHAQSMATVRLTVIAWERAIHGGVERLYRDGELIAERRRPSDKLLMWLLAHHDPVTYGWLAKPPRAHTDPSFYPVQSARKELPLLLGQLADMDPADCPAERLSAEDLEPDEAPLRA